MLLLKTGFMCLLLSLCTTNTFAQSSPLSKDGDFKKSEIFSDLPQRININKQAFAALLQKEIGEKVTFPLSPGFTFLGTVVSKSNVADGRSRTIVIKSSNRQGAAFTITGIKKSDGSFRYSGRMLSLKHSDAYEMVEKDGQCALQKKPLADLVTE